MEIADFLLFLQGTVKWYWRTNSGLPMTTGAATRACIKINNT